MTSDKPNTEGQPGIESNTSIFGAALFGLCPQCGARALFAKELLGVAKFAPSCRACGLDFASFNVGDGPAAFVTLIIGAVVVALAIWLEVSWQPPFWLHVVLWVPITVLGIIWGLRAGKAALLAAEYSRKAGESTTRDGT